MCSCDGHACERTIDYLNLGNYVYYLGNGATSEKYSVDYPQNNVTINKNKKSKEYRLHISLEKPVDEGYQLIKNMYLRNESMFRGWYMYQYEGNVKFWFCKDGNWHSTKELKEQKTEKKLWKDEEIVRGFSRKNIYPVFLEAQWKDPVVKRIKRKLKRELKKVYKKVVH